MSRWVLRSPPHTQAPVAAGSARGGFSTHRPSQALGAVRAPSCRPKAKHRMTFFLNFRVEPGKQPGGERALALPQAELGAGGGQPDACAPSPPRPGLRDPGLNQPPGLHISLIWDSVYACVLPRLRLVVDPICYGKSQ